MARPDYIICLECESEVADFTWREGEIRRAICEVCGNPGRLRTDRYWQRTLCDEHAFRR